MIHASGGNVMIHLNDVGKRFRVAPGPGRKGVVVEAVRAVSLTLEAGTVIGVVGPNGAGKTTFLGLLLGFLEPTSGSLSIAGEEPRAYVRKRGASYLPQRFQLPRDWTIRPALAALLSLDGAQRDVDELLEQFELTEYGNAKAHTLSHGTMQRVGIAQAFATPRTLVVLDEPTEGLDTKWRARFRELVTQLRSPERVVLIATHDLEEIEPLADRMLALEDGRVTHARALS